MANRSQNPERSALIVAIGFGACAVVVSAAVAAAPRGSHPVAVLASPWAGAGSALRVISAAESRIISQGRYGWIAVAFDDRPALSERLYRAGALVVADATVATACIRLTNWTFGRGND